MGMELELENCVICQSEDIENIESRVHAYEYICECSGQYYYSFAGSELETLREVFGLHRSEIAEVLQRGEYKPLNDMPVHQSRRAITAKDIYNLG